MQASDPADKGALQGCLSNRSASITAKGGAILATARYLLAPEDTSAGSRPMMLPAPLLGRPLAGPVFKALFWVGAAVGLGLGIALLG